MQNKSEREGIIEHTNCLIKQNNDDIKNLQSQLDMTANNDDKKEITKKLKD